MPEPTPGAADGTTPGSDATSGQTATPTTEERLALMEKELANNKKALADAAALLEKTKQDLTSTNAESRDRRHTLRSIKEQHDDLIKAHNDKIAETAALQKQIEDRDKELASLRSGDDAKRKQIIDSMKPEHQEAFKDLSMTALERIHQDLYVTPAGATSTTAGADQQTSTTSQAGGKPAPISPTPTTSLDKAAESGDYNAINAAFDRELASPGS